MDPRRSSQEILRRWYVACRNAVGNHIRVGVAVTKSGRIVLIYPDGPAPVMNADQAIEHQIQIRRAVTEAATRE